MSKREVTFRGPAPGPVRLSRAGCVGLFIAAMIAVIWWALGGKVP